MDRLQSMVVFVAVADAAGFAPAARRLGMSPPAVTRAVAELEQRVGARLVHRTTRMVRLTEAGARFVEDCRRILAEIREAEEAAAGAHQEPRGPLHVTASVLFGRMHVTPILLEFLERYPKVTAETLFVDRVVDLLGEGLDVAVRIGQLPDSSLSALKVGHVRRVVCAAPGYLAARDVPQHPDELARHDTITFTGIGGGPDWAFVDGGRQLAVRPPSRLTVNTADVALAAALAGRGLTQVLSYMVAADVAAGRLELVLTGYEPPPVPVHLVHHAGRQAAARVRAFVDFAAERLRANGAIN